MDKLSFSQSGAAATRLITASMTTEATDRRGGVSVGAEFKGESDEIMVADEAKARGG